MPVSLAQTLCPTETVRVAADIAAGDFEDRDSVTAGATLIREPRVPVAGIGANQISHGRSFAFSTWSVRPTIRPSSLATARVKMVALKMGLLFWLVLAAAVAFVGYLLFDAILGWTRQRRFYRRRHRHRD